LDLWLVGYGAWPAPKRAAGLVEALRSRGVTNLVDVRLNPCASDTVAGRPYGPKAWNLQAGREGLVGLLDTVGIGYTWLVELGNPQRQDRSMNVLRAQLADPAGDWPVHRGLERLAAMVREGGETHALLCACSIGRACHRTLIAGALNSRHFDGKLALREVVSPRNRGDSAAEIG
jgi:uncharacterized protein (DUF488 family)